ncbi:MAG TPA: hypothetical protein VFE37_15160 [Chloroflexota bacterium]|nr:hypothetical protein [Chloroflexota bacterium]
MATLYETLPATQQLVLAVQARTPSQLAQTFAAFVGQFYDREAFDALARQVNGLYDAERGGCFRAQLDRRLHDRYHAPVAWDVGPASADRVA